MKTLVIHPSDPTTDFLRTIYEDMEVDVIGGESSGFGLAKSLGVVDECERIIMLGHGTPQGLLAGYRHIINDSHAEILKNKICVGIWCHANLFFNKHGLKGFHTGMFISEVDEAQMYDVEATQTEIDWSNNLFASLVRQYIDSDDVVGNIKKYYVGNEVIQFNRERLFCNV